MKKLVIFISIITTLIFSNNVYSYDITNKDKIIINKLTYKLDEEIKNKSYNYKLFIIKRLHNLENKYRNNQRLYIIIKSIIINLENYVCSRD